MLLKDRIAIQQARQAQHKRAILTDYQQRQSQAKQIKDAKHAHMAHLAEQANNRRRILTAAYEKAEHDHLTILANNKSKAFTCADIKALRPCGRLDTLKELIAHHWANNQAIDIHRAVAQGATYGDIKWVVTKLMKHNALIRQQYELWHAEYSTELSHPRNDHDHWFARLIYYMSPKLTLDT